jgi:hypothetical protein
MKKFKESLKENEEFVLFADDTILVNERSQMKSMIKRYEEVVIEGGLIINKKMIYIETCKQYLY